MCKFLTGKARIQQVDRKRMWMLLDNEVFKANDGNIYLAPRTMYTDNYTIPLWVSWIAGSPVDYDTRCSHIHDCWCYTHEALIITLSEKELKKRGYLKYSRHKRMWVCEDIPAEFLAKRKVGKFETNNMLYECMEAAGEPWLSRALVRLGVCFNLGWYINLWFGKVFSLDLERVYEEEYWREKTEGYK